MFTHETIRELRLALGLTLREFADLMDVTVATASRWESAREDKRRHPTFAKMVKLNELAQQRGVKLGRKLQSV